MATIDPTAFVHPSADVEDEVEIGAGTRVWARTHLRRGVRLGRDCNIGENALIDLGVRLGDRCKVQTGALLYHGSVIDDDVFIGPAVCLTNDRLPRAATPDGELKSDADWTVSEVVLERGCSLGAHAVVVAGCRIGTWAMVGSGSVVTRDVPAYALVVGNPARRVGWVCACGEKLDDELHCGACGRSYRHQGDGLAMVGSDQPG